MCVKHSDLFFTSIWISDVIAVHPGEELSGSPVNTGIETVAKAPVFLFPENLYPGILRRQILQQFPERGCLPSR